MMFQPLGPENSGEILEFITSLEKADGSPLRTSHAEVEGFFDKALTWRAFGLRGKSNDLIAFGLARTINNGGEVRLSGGVHPNERGRGIGSLLVAELVASARKIAGKEAVVHVDSSNVELAEILKRKGFQHSHEYVQLRKSVTAFPDFPAPSSILITQLTEQYDADIVRFLNNARAQIGHGSISHDAWKAEHSFIDRNWSFVALDTRGDRPRIAAYLVCERYEEEWEMLGWSEGYIAEVALGEEWRGLNLISALLTHCVEAIRSCDVSYVGIDMLDGDYLLSTFIDRGFERTGATDVYQLQL